MADRREVLDYLRNQQKAAEIEAKMNGVNIWVLLGAIAVVGWQLTSSPGGKLWCDNELIARTLVSSVALYVLLWLIGHPRGECDELRYSSTNFDEVDSPFLLLLIGVLILLPSAWLLIADGKSVGAIALSFLCLAFVVFSCELILKTLFPSSKNKGRFPEPNFGFTKRANFTIDLVLGVLFVVAIVEQIIYFRGIPEGISIDDARPMILLAVLYHLVLFTISLRQQNDSIAWTYELETDIVLGVISPEVAIRRIENRALGPRLQDVVDRFTDNLDQRFGELDAMLKECAGKVSAAREVPAQYPAERAARVKEASEKVANQINSLAVDCKEFRGYLVKLEKKAGGRKTVLAPVLASLKARHESYDERTRTAKLELERLLA